MDIDFPGLDTIAASTKLIEKKRYAFEITGVDPEEVNENSGKKSIRLDVSVIDGPDYEDGTQSLGASRTIRLPHPRPDMKDGGTFCTRRIAGLMDACGLARSPGVKHSYEELLGKSFTAFVKYQTKDQDGNELDEPREDYGSFKKYEGRV